MSANHRSSYSHFSARFRETMLEVDLTVRRPCTSALVVILGGHLNARDAVRLLEETPGVVVAVLSYPFTGDPQPSAATQPSWTHPQRSWSPWPTS